ncbi:hypothetical protein ACFSOZ_04265 [Mesorhizobium newzealandense]|uniref:Uncharacterized protein n=1 Tax=Mesorhizobium newzealandense TaxID=1300302 RepID=A0ABW4U3F8_9HYPH
MGIRITRRSDTSDYRTEWKGEEPGIYGAELGGVNVYFQRPVGKGRTHFELEIMPDKFVELAKAMMEAAPREAIKAFGKALATAKLDR